MSGKKWSHGEVDSLLSWCKQGWSNAKIAQKLNRSIEAVESKKKYLKILVKETQAVQQGEELNEGISKAVEIHKLKELQKEIRKRDNSFYGNKARYELNVEEFKDVLPKITLPKDINIKVKYEQNHTEDAMLILSDIHFGEVVQASHVSGLNEYNFAVAERRLNDVINTAADLLINKLKGYTFKCLHIALLGDVISGIIHKELEDNLEFPLGEVQAKSAAALIKVINELSRIAPKTKVYCFVGNHGRLTPEYNFKDKTTKNHEYIIYKFIEKALEPNKKVEITIPLGGYEVINVNGHKILMFHGDILKGFSPASIKKFLNELRLSVDFDSCCFGHFHNSLSFAYGDKGKVLCNGSVIGTTEHSNLSMGTSTVPKQWLVGVHPDRISWQFEIECNRR